MEASATKTPDQLLAEIRALAIQLTDLTGNKVQETGEPLLFCTGQWDMRLIGSKQFIGFVTEFGTVGCYFDPSGLLRLLGQSLLLQAAALDVQRGAVEASEARGKGPLN